MPIDQPVAARSFPGIDSAGVLSYRFERLLLFAQVVPRRFGLVNVRVGIDDRHMHLATGDCADNNHKLPGAVKSGSSRLRKALLRRQSVRKRRFVLRYGALSLPTQDDRMNRV